MLYSKTQAHVGLPAHNTPDQLAAACFVIIRQSNSKPTRRTCFKHAQQLCCA
jgi:hypothetical protein